MKRCFKLLTILLILTNFCFAQEKFCVDSISFVGNIATKRPLLLRELNFATHDCIAKDSISVILNIGKERLFNTQLFNKVTVDTLSEDNKGVVIFFAEDRFPIFPKPALEFADRNFNVWYKEQGAKINRLNLGLELIHQNIRGRREQLGVKAQVGYTQQFTLSYNIPFLNKKKTQGIGFSLASLKNLEMNAFSSANKLEFHRFESLPALRQQDASVWYHYRPKFATTHSVYLNYKHLQLHDSIANFINPNYLGDGRNKGNIISLRYRVAYNGVDNWNYPLKGYRWIVTAKTDYLVGKKFMPSIHVQADWYKQIYKRWYYNNIFRGRIAYGNSLPYIFQRNMGYDFDEMRGYEYSVFDGTAFALLRGNLKYKVLDTHVKLPIKYFNQIPIRVFLKGLADAGYAYNKDKGNNTLSNKFLYSYGFGVDIVTLYDIRLRLEYVKNSNGLKDMYFHKSGE